MPERPDGLAAVAGAKRFTRILDQGEAVLRGDLPERLELDRVSEDVDRQKRSRAGRNRALDRGGVEVERLAVDVDEHRPRAFVERTVRRGYERERRRDHLVAFGDLGHAHCEMEPSRSVRDSDRERRIDSGGKVRLETLDHRAERQTARAQNLGDHLALTLVDRGAGERNRLSHASPAG